MTRKRFIKLMMAKGIQIREARKLADKRHYVNGIYIFIGAADYLSASLKRASIAIKKFAAIVGVDLSSKQDMTSYRIMGRKNT